MSAPGGHLHQERLSEKAMEVLEGLKGFLNSLDFKPKRNNLHHCNDQAALYDVIQRLIMELQFITIKVQYNTKHT